MTLSVSDPLHKPSVSVRNSVSVESESVRKFQYWSTQKVPSTTPVFLFGNTLQRLGLTMPFYEFLERAYHESNGKDFCGFYEFMKPGLIISNPQLLQSILIRDFDHFNERRAMRLGKVGGGTGQGGWCCCWARWVVLLGKVGGAAAGQGGWCCWARWVVMLGKVNPVANKMLTNARGDEWKMIRSVVSPTFTAHRTRGIYPLLQQQSELLLQNVSACTNLSSCCLQTKSLCDKYMMGAIASCAFGIQQNSGDDALLFPEMAAGLLSLTWLRAIKVMVLLVTPRLADLLGYLGFEFTSKEFVFFKRVVRYTVDVRRKAGTWRGDFLDLMRDTKKLSEDYMTAQSVLFLLAGYANTSVTLALALHHLAQYPHLQATLRRELEVAFQESRSRRLDYDALQSLAWLGAVVDETLRLYPGGPVVERVCTKDYTLGSTKVAVKKGQPIIVPVWSIHRDPANWPDPHTFNPERFLPHNKRDVKPFTYLPFGVGPRSCVGLRFADLAVKEGLVALLSQFQIRPCGSHSVHPPPIHSKIFTLKTDNLLPLHFTPIVDIKSIILKESTMYPLLSWEKEMYQDVFSKILNDNAAV
ncbi:Cytochrome P450 [Trinorchestia longiramus]|nr:Cytochrome P450 [Trinorchestia longiramus]